MRKRRNFRKKPKDNSIGLSVTVFNNNVEGALKVLKKKIKASNLFQDLRDKEMDFFYFKDYFLRLCLAVFLIFPFSPSLDIASLKPI